MRISIKLFTILVIALGAMVALTSLVRPAPDYTAQSPLPENSWDFIIYDDQDNAYVEDYNLTLEECLIASEASKARSKACERAR